jgi:hypothetical protein
LMTGMSQIPYHVRVHKCSSFPLPDLLCPFYTRKLLFILQVLT